MTDTKSGSPTNIMTKGLRGLGELFLGTPPGGMDKQKRIMTRKNSMQGVFHEDVVMDNPASEKVPLLQEEGKVKRPFVTADPPRERKGGFCQSSRCFFVTMVKKHTLFVLLGFMAGLVFSVCLIFGSVSPHLLKKAPRLDSAENDRIVFTGLLALLAGSISTGIAVKTIVKAVVHGLAILRKNNDVLDFAHIRTGFLDEGRAAHLLVKEGLQETTAKQVIKDLQIADVASASGSQACKNNGILSPCLSSAFTSVSFGGGAAVPLLPWFLNVYVLKYALDVMSQVYFTVALVVLCVYLCGTLLELHFQMNVKGNTSSFSPLVTGFKHLLFIVLATGTGLAVGLLVQCSLKM